VYDSAQEFLHHQLMAWSYLCAALTGGMECAIIVTAATPWRELNLCVIVDGVE
jgi:hypothetical protein